MFVYFFSSIFVAERVAPVRCREGGAGWGAAAAASPRRPGRVSEAAASSRWRWRRGPPRPSGAGGGQPGVPAAGLQGASSAPTGQLRTTTAAVPAGSEAGRGDDARDPGKR